jgi:hypothetical protein
MALIVREDVCFFMAPKYMLAIFTCARRSYPVESDIGKSVKQVNPDTEA